MGTMCNCGVSTCKNVANDQRQNTKITKSEEKRRKVRKKTSKGKGQSKARGRRTRKKAGKNERAYRMEYWDINLLTEQCGQVSSEMGRKIKQNYRQQLYNELSEEKWEINDRNKEKMTEKETNSPQ